MDVIDPDSSTNMGHEVVVLESNVLRPWSKVMPASHCDARLIVFPDLAMEVGFVDVERKDLIYLFHLRHEWDNFL